MRLRASSKDEAIGTVVSIARSINSKLLTMHFTMYATVPDTNQKVTALAGMH